MEEFILVNLENAPGKTVKIPKNLVTPGASVHLRARAFAVESGQATWAEVNGEDAVNPGVSGKFDAAMVGAGRMVDRTASNLSQLGNELFGDDEAAQANIAEQAEIKRLAAPVKEDFPVSSFLGEMLPNFAVPGGLGVQTGVGALQGALEGDTPAERGIGGAVGGALAFGGGKLGDNLGLRFQNRIQRATGNPNAAARRALIDADVPLSLSQRTDGPISKPLARFFERGRFVLTGNQPKGTAQQARLTELVTDALGVKGKKLNRQVLGEAVENNRAVFRNAADRAGGRFFADDTLVQQAEGITSAFDNVGTDSPQVQRVFERFEDFVTSDSLEGVNASQVLKLRSDLSQATTKTDIETDAVVDAIGAIDDLITRNVPDLAEDLTLARDRFRMLMALRRGQALSPQGDINTRTFTNNLERIFRDFDANQPLPRSLGPAGEAMAGFDQIATPFRSSGTAENAAALALPGGAGATDPSALLKIASGLAAPFSGGGAGSQIGGGSSRALIQELLNKAGIPSEI